VVHSRHLSREYRLSSPPSSDSPTKTFGLASGIGLVIANMVGAGVFLSTGFMAQSLGPGHILLAWLIGAVLALCGAVAYAEVARLVPHSGGEYRYLSTLLHPSLGYLAGWASLLVGFSAPIALDAVAAGAFARAVWPVIDPRLLGALCIVALSALHATGLQSSARAQNALVGLKVLLVLGFVGVGIAFGTMTWPTWQPPKPGPSPWPDLVGSLFFIAFAFSGWNAAIYAAEEFRSPGRDVPRAMLLGCLAVGVLYLVVNFLFVANLTPQQGTVVFQYDDFTSLKGQYEQVTLGQAVMSALLGPAAARVMSGVMVLLFVSAMSAMMLVGPRVYAAMARDGYLPAALGGAKGKPPVWAIALQGALALLLLLTHDVRTVLSNVGAILVLFAALTVSGLFRAALTAATPEAKPKPLALVAAGAYVLTSAWMLYTGFKRTPMLLVWIAGVSAVALVAWWGTRRLSRRTA
jgi:APA family basic amino acid/polyamine antiporter